jgi:hypothetical protein
MRKCVCTLLLVLAASAPAALAGDEKAAGQPQYDPAAAQAAMMAAMQPGEHHEHMKKLLGTYNFTLKMWMDPSAPPTESTGKRTSEMLLGGRYLEEKYTGTFMGMPFEGIGLMGYDNVTKQYVGTWIDNMGTGIMTSHGQCDKSGWTMVGESSDPMTGKTWTSRSVVKCIDDNTFTMEMYAPGPDGKEFKMMEMTCKRAAM